MRISGPRRLFPAVTLAVFSLCGAVGQPASDPAFAMASRAPVVGSPAPDFELFNLKGEQVRLSAYQGRIVLINFWATWCKPCVKEMPAMQSVYEDLRSEGFVVLAINELEEEARVRAYVEQHGHTFPVLLDRDNLVANRYGVRGLPVTVFVDGSGHVTDYLQGGLLTESFIRNTVARLLAKPPSNFSNSITP